MTYEEYEQKKKTQFEIFISKVFSFAGDVDSETLYKEAKDKFEKEYPIWTEA